MHASIVNLGVVDNPESDCHALSNVIRYVQAAAVVRERLVFWRALKDVMLFLSKERNNYVCYK